MSSPAEPHDPELEVERQDSIVLTALGEPIDALFAEHFESCAACAAELSALREVAGLARAGSEVGPSDVAPSPLVWDRISDELGLAPDPDDAPVRPLRSAPVATERTRWWSGGTRTLVAAAVVLGLLVGVVGFLVGRSSTSSDPSSLVASAQLSAMPGGPTGVAGTAVVSSTPSGKELTVSTDGLASRDGYYEVWMFDPDRNEMVAIGTLGGDHSGTFPIPPGLDPAGYHVVDVSAQLYDGDPVHRQSVLRGSLGP